MINISLIKFIRDTNLENKADLGEKIGDFGLGLLRIGFGKTVIIETSSGGAGKITFTEKMYSTSTRVAAVALFILMLPVTIVLSGIGYIGTACSKSHKQMVNLYERNIQIDDNMHQQNPISVTSLDTSKDRAATIIQRNFRSYLARKAHLPGGLLPASRLSSLDTSKDRAATIIQRNFRSYLARKAHLPGGLLPASRLSSLDISEDRAATIIQRHFRGYLARKAHLPGGLYSQYYALCERAMGPESLLMPQAHGGNTAVYLPKEMPWVVLKNSGRKEAITRFHQMQDIRSILASQNSSHLIIPKANLCQEFLVEQRLPIDADSYHNMGIYLDNPELFDEAVRELTRLFSKVYLSDLISHQYNPLGNIEGVGDFVRYDNLPMYVVEENGSKKGKIGLVDLEHIHKGQNSQGLETLVRIFPLHLSVIKNEASMLKMNVDENALNVAMNKGIKYLKVGYMDHRNWLKHKGAFTKMSSQPLQVSSQRIKALNCTLEKELLKINKGINDAFVMQNYPIKPQKNIFTKNPEKMSKELAESIVPMILNNIKTQIEKKLSKQLDQELTESKLVSLRSLVIKREQLYKGVDTLLLRHPAINLGKDEMMESQEVAKQLTYVLMQELVKGGEIFYFDPAYYTRGHALCWVRY